MQVSNRKQRSSLTVVVYIGCNRSQLKRCLNEETVTDHDRLALDASRDTQLT